MSHYVTTCFGRRPQDWRRRQERNRIQRLRPEIKSDRTCDLHMSPLLLSFRLSLFPFQGSHPD